MTIVLDTNIWLSLALRDELDLLAKLHHKKVIIAGCTELINELVDVLTRPKFSKRFSKAYIETFIAFYFSATTTYKIGSIDVIVTDPKDNYLFALAKASNADFFVTGDKLLLDVESYGITSIITLASFRNINA